MAVLQNQWWLNGAKIVDETGARYLCARFARYVTNPMHALMIFVKNDVITYDIIVLLNGQ